METKLTQYAIGQAEYPAYPAFVNAEDYYRKDGSWDHEAYEQAREAARQALALAVDEGYGLQVRYEDGREETVRAGEVSVRGLYGYV